MIKNPRKLWVLCLTFIIILSGNAQDRPFIWVTKQEKEAILEKIQQHTWAASIYDSYFQRLESDISEYEKDADEFLKKMPFDWENAQNGETPPFKKVDYKKPGQSKVADHFMWYLQVGVDCGIAYYLTDNEKYAQCGLDILNAFIEGLIQLDLDSNTGNGGWLYENGEHLREAREIGAQIPVIYDFVYPFIEAGGKPYDLGKQARIEFPQEKAQQVFRTYVDLAINRGHTGSNWSVLESPSMVQNLLALEDINERNKYLQVYLTTGSNRQDPLSAIAVHYKNEGDIWPETSQYSNVVANWTTYLMMILTKYNPELHLAKKYKNIPLALSRWEDMKYPNNEIVRFGDGNRYGGSSYSACEVAYRLGEIADVPELVEKFGPFINSAIQEGKYERGKFGPHPLRASAYFQPLSLLWFADDIDGEAELKELPRTDHLQHASLFLQRNLSETDSPEDGLMCFVAGNQMVHGHANGMDMELYGEGEVLGIDNGRDNYTSEIHENYYRLFAAHNTVIVNGSSQSDDGWVNLGINPVELVSMEPMPGKTAVSPYHSFTQTSFVDDMGDEAEAIQQRTMALIRTSPTSGFYVDVFRSKSKLDRQFHDYLYHNIGDKVEFLNDDLKLHPDPERYKANANNPWVQNSQFRHPGWHYFKEIETSSGYTNDIEAVFSLKTIKKGPLYMKMYITGEENREYTRVVAPRDKEAPKPYNQKGVPVVIVRKKGEAWTKPFAVVYEPYSGSEMESNIQSVKRIEEKGIYKGLKVISNTGKETLVQYIITHPENEEFRDLESAIKFNGTFAVVTTDEKGKVLNLYMGNGKELSCGGVTISAKNKHASAYLDVSVENPVLISGENDQISFSVEKE